MTTNTLLFKGQIWQDSPFQVLGRVYGDDGLPIDPATVTDIKCNSYDLDGADPNAVVHTENFTNADISPSLIVGDPRWTVDSTGFNAAHDLDPAHVANATRRLRIEILYTTSAGNLALVGEVTVHDLKSV